MIFNRGTWTRYAPRWNQDGTLASFATERKLNMNSYELLTPEGIGKGIWSRGECYFIPKIPVVWP